MADGPVFLDEGYFKGSPDPQTLAPRRQQHGPNSSLASLSLGSGGGGGGRTSAAGGGGGGLTPSGI